MSIDISPEEPDTFLSDRAKYAGLVLNRGHDDPSTIAQREFLAQESMVRAVRNALRKAPKMLPETRSRIEALLDAAS